MNELNMTANDLVAIIPAAGKATRLPSIQISKEIIPIGYLNKSANTEKMDKPVSYYLLEKLKLANIRKTIMIIRDGKWDIPKMLGSGNKLDMEIAYQMLTLPYGTAYTIDQTYPFVRNSIVALGFPDILFESENAYQIILDELISSNADVVLGLFPADKPHKVDMIEMDGNGKVNNIVIKPKQTELEFSWAIAVWRPSFSKFLHEQLSSRKTSDTDPELFIGDIIQSGITHGLSVKGVQVSKEPFLDIGTPDDLAIALQRYSIEN